jgi:hypothetical protein
MTCPRRELFFIEMLYVSNIHYRYTKRYFENGTNEHSVSIGQAQVDNLLPDDRYRTILTSNCQQQHTMIRVYCKEGESVGGIAVKEHLGNSKENDLYSK